MSNPLTVQEMARVDAWREAQARLAAERERERNARAPCAIHGPGAGRILYGPAPYGYGPVCKHCRREWSRRNGGKRWESEQQARERKQAERLAMVSEGESMLPAEFYLAWEVLRLARQKATRGHLHSRDDEFGVSSFGCLTPDGQRYVAMRDRVRREQRAFAEARAVI